MTRNLLFDNIKLAMVFLVVFGHLIEPLLDHGHLARTLYMFIYSFHMPVFIMLAGALTKLDESEKRSYKNIASIIVPFVVFTLLYELINLLGYRTISHYTLNFEPHWILWFLFSLFIWKLAFPIIMKLRFPLVISVIISLCAGYVDDVGSFLSISRTLYFFPFFILGYKLNNTLIAKDRLFNLPAIFYWALLALIFVGLFIFKEVPYQWFYGGDSYANLGVESNYGFVYRLFCYGLSTIAALAVFMVIPNRGEKVASYGENSLYVYAWHGLFIKVAVYFGIMSSVAEMSSLTALLIFFVASVLLTMLLASHWMASLTNKLLLQPAQQLLLSNK
ncbi:acyltransferase family protein [Oceanisphaera avium]|nr:acyltransferase family protein [Oceanisphaera avium]